jgi:hypothetical protein
MGLRPKKATVLRAYCGRVWVTVGVPYAGMPNLLGSTTSRWWQGAARSCCAWNPCDLEFADYRETLLAGRLRGRGFGLRAATAASSASLAQGIISPGDSSASSGGVW